MSKNFWSDYSVAVYGVPLGAYGDEPGQPDTTPPTNSTEINDPWKDATP